MMKPHRKAHGEGARLTRLGFVGLGKMGRAMVERLLEKGYEVAAFDIDRKAVDAVAQGGATAVESLDSLARLLIPPRLVWIMVPHETVDTVLGRLVPCLSKGDTVIDGGNTFYRDSIRRAASLRAPGIHFLDVGVSGGPRGARTGSCIMVGGKREVFDRHEDLFRDLSAVDGYRHVGAHGAGHFVKMVHNGVEYGMMQALAEGFSVMKSSPFNLDLTTVADLYNHGSVIASRLVGWLAEAFHDYGENLETVSGSVSQSGEGIWTVEAGREYGVPTPVIEEAVNFRKVSEAHGSYTGRVVSALRNEFGQHDVFEK